MDTSGNLYKNLNVAIEKQFKQNIKDGVANKGDKLFEVTEEQAEIMEPMTKHKRKGYMRNQPCICGSGEKFKKCCW